MGFRHDPEGKRLPIKIDSTSNGEFRPIPLDQASRTGNRFAIEQVGNQARRIGLERRAFLVSACGAATTLLAFNEANAAMGRSGGFYNISPEAVSDLELAAAELGGKDLIFDMHGHYVDPSGAWLARAPCPPSTRPSLRAGCGLGADESERAYLRQLGPDAFIRDVFLDSDTDIMVLSFVPTGPDDEPLSIEEAAATREIVARMQGGHRLMIHGRVNPNQAGDLADMERRAAFGVAAWKTHTQWGPDGRGFYLTDEDTGVAMIETARSLGTPIIAVHKGVPLGPDSYEHSLCTDVGPAAVRFPDTRFLIYHAGYIPGRKEGAYDPDRGEGVDGLIRSVLDHGKPRNIYAELGTTWRFAMRDPEEAAHLIGKLLKYLGPDRILWGTDSIWYGSPQDQIQAFRTFQISEEFQERFGYPEITPEIRARIFGLNALRVYGIDTALPADLAKGDPITQERKAYRHEPDPHFRTFGPKNRREFANLLRWNGGERA